MFEPTIVPTATSFAPKMIEVRHTASSGREVKKPTRVIPTTNWDNPKRSAMLAEFSVTLAAHFNNKKRPVKKRTRFNSSFIRALVAISILSSDPPYIYWIQVNTR